MGFYSNTHTCKENVTNDTVKETEKYFHATFLQTFMLFEGELCQQRSSFQETEQQLT